MKNRYTETICNALEQNKAALKKQFQESISECGVRFCFLDGLLPEESALEIYHAFPAADRMRFMNSTKEQKYTSKDFDGFNLILKEITFAIQSPEVIRIIEEITGIPDQEADETLYAGGLSLMSQGNFLNPHIDNSHDMSRQRYRTLNLLYYTTPHWKVENGGNLELWDRSVKNNVVIHSRFNRLVLMETNPWSWHSVSKVSAEGQRTCVSNYYFSRYSPIGKDYFNVTSFQGRPDETFRRLFLPVENRLRNLIRKVKKEGFGKKDVYRGGKAP
ncbi:MAG: 2OG-Fe(II) oxygenase [Leptospiraceae bacterium]